MTGESQFLPAGLVARIEGHTGSVIAAVIPRAGGGASRQGAQISLAWPDGRRAEAYLAYDSRAGDPRRLPFFNREVAILQALSGPLADTGIRVPRFLAADPDHLALLTELVPGTDKPSSDPGEFASAAMDCVAQLAALHRIAPVALEGFGDPDLAVSTRIAARIRELRAENLVGEPDPVLLLALAWLERNIPADAGPAVIAHGDAGPGNFLHQGGRVTALLDWELAHYGDPMEDLAQIWVRMLFQPFLPMAKVFEAYEAAGGRAVNLGRVRYHRLFFQLGFITSTHSDLFGDGNVRSANLGVTMMFYTAHMRVIVQSLAELAGVQLPVVPLPEVTLGATDRSFEIALDDIRDVIAPRAVDQQAAVKAKSLARLVKYWRARDRYGPAFDAAEMGEVSDELGQLFVSVTEARRALGIAVAQGKIDFGPALLLCHARMTRDTALMADAMGALATTYFPPLD